MKVYADLKNSAIIYWSICDMMMEICSSLTDYNNPQDPCLQMVLQDLDTRLSLTYRATRATGPESCPRSTPLEVESK